MRCVGSVELLELTEVLAELERATLTSYSNRQLTIGQLVSHLMSLLTTIDPHRNDHDDQASAFNVQLYTDLVLNWLLNVYDR